MDVRVGFNLLYWTCVLNMCMMKFGGASSATKMAQSALWPTSMTPSTSATTETAEILTFDFQSGLTETVNKYRLNIDSSSRFVKDSYVPSTAMDSSFTPASHSFVPSKESTMINISRTHNNFFVSNPSNTYTFRSGFTSRASIIAQTVSTRSVAMSGASASSKTQEVINDSISLLSYISFEVLYSSEFIPDCTLQGLCTFSTMSATAHTPITSSDVTSKLLTVSSVIASSFKSVSSKNYFGFFTIPVSSSVFHLQNSKLSRNSLWPSLTISFTAHDSSATFDGPVSVVAQSETQLSASEVSSSRKIRRTIDANSELASSPKTSRTDFTDLTADSVTTTVTSWDDSVIFSSTQLSSTPYLHSQTSSAKSTYIRPTPSLTTSKPSQTVTTEDLGENLTRCNTGQQQVDNFLGISYKELTFIFAGTAATLLCIFIPFVCCCCRYRRQLQEAYEDVIARLGKEEDLRKVKRTDLQHMLKHRMKAARYERKIKKQQKQERSTDNKKAASGVELSEVEKTHKRRKSRGRISDVFTEIKAPHRTERPVIQSTRSSVAESETFEPQTEYHYFNVNDTRGSSTMRAKIKTKRNTKRGIRKFQAHDERSDTVKSDFLSVRSAQSYRSSPLNSVVNIPDVRFCDGRGLVLSSFGKVSDDLKVNRF